MSEKIKYKKAFMDMAFVFSKTSEAKRLQVGCLLVRNDTVIALGVNGQPPGWPSEICEDDSNTTLPTVRHAEEAALQKLWKSTETSVGADAYVTHVPCLSCAIKLKTAGIKRVFYRETYRDTSGLEYLEKNGVCVEKL